MYSHLRRLARKINRSPQDLLPVQLLRFCRFCVRVVRSVFPSVSPSETRLDFPSHWVSITRWRLIWLWFCWSRRSSARTFPSFIPIIPCSIQSLRVCHCAATIGMDMPRDLLEGVAQSSVGRIPRNVQHQGVQASQGQQDRSKSELGDDVG